jgi:hypothetical protein
MGRHQEGLSAAAEYKRDDRHMWKGTTEEVRARCGKELFF